MKRAGDSQVSHRPVLTMPPFGRNTAPVVPSENPLAPVMRDCQQ